MIKDSDMASMGYKKSIGGLWENEGHLYRIRGNVIEEVQKQESKQEAKTELVSQPVESKEKTNAIVPALSTVPNIVRPVVSTDEAVAAWNQFQDLKKRLWTDNDYMVIRGKQAPCKSAWRKAATFFNLSDEIVETKVEVNEDGDAVRATFVVRVIAPNGRYGTGWGSCSLTEKAHKTDKTNDKGVVSCKGPCDGRPHFAHFMYDIPAIAHTRAKNRAISDLIGGGETSAEEVLD